MNVIFRAAALAMAGLVQAGAADPAVEELDLTRERVQVDDGDGSCTHQDGFIYAPSGYVSPAWESPRDGQQLFLDTFTNESSVMQSFSRTITGQVMATFNASLNIYWVALQVGATVTVTLSQMFNVVVPAMSKLSMRANANMMDRRIGVLKVCRRCHASLSLFKGTFSAARGINEYFTKIP